jgi:hypothetical protein
MAPHDPLFKRLLRTFFADFLRLVAPSLVERLDLAATVFLDKEFPSPGPPGRSRIVDLLARVPLRRGGGRSLLVHVEIEARAKRKIGERLRDYHDWIHTHHPGQILSVVVFLKDGRGGVQEERLEEDFAGPGLPTFRYLSFGLRRCLAAEYLVRREPLAWALAALMNPGDWSRARLKWNCLQRITGVPLEDAKRRDLVYCIESYLQLTSREAAEFASLGVLEERRSQTMSMSLYTWTDLREIEKEKQGARTVLLSVLEQKFGQIPAEVRARVERVRSVERLARLAQRAVTAKSLKSLRLA